MRLLTPTLAGACILVLFRLLLTVSAQQPAAPPAAPAQTPAAPAAGRARGAAPIQQTVWSPKAVKPTGYTGVHKPHTKLADVLGQTQRRDRLGGERRWTMRRCTATTS